jgi:trehalose/maltose hydrolase-like predicted phosphorylase
VLHIEPQLVSRLDGLVMPLQFQGTSIRVSISGDELTVLSRAEGFRRPVRIAVRDEVRAPGPGESRVVALVPDRAEP